MKKLPSILIASLAGVAASLRMAVTGEGLFPGARNAGALNILGGSGYQRGVETAETGINCETQEVRYFPEVNEDLAGITGEVFLTAKSAKFSRDISLSGEVNSSSGVMAFGLTAACAVANDVGTFGDGTGTILLDEATETQGRQAFRAAAFRLSSKPLRIVV